MPHNRTRIWVGLAIVAITIPAVGEYYIHSKGGDLSGSMMARSARLPGEDGSRRTLSTGSLANFSKGRDYVAEVSAALGHSVGADADAVPLAGSDDDPTFDVSPYDESDDDANASDDAAASRTAPDPTALKAAAQDGAVAYSTDGPVNADPTATPDTQGIGTDSATAVGDGLSDTAVYRIVSDNLSADEREDFARTYAAMTPNQRTDLLDGFRDQMQGNGG